MKKVPGFIVVLIFSIIISFGIRTDRAYTQGVEAPPFRLPFQDPPSPTTWLLGQAYGNTVGAYRQRASAYSAGQGLHFGVDLSARCGYPVVAIGDGVVVFGIAQSPSQHRTRIACIPCRLKVPNIVNPLHQCATLFIAQQDSFLAKFLAKYLILRAQVVDDLLLLAVDPAGKNDQRQLPRLQNEFHRPLGNCAKPRQLLM